MRENIQDGLVTVAPGEVLGAHVLVGVLDALLKRGHVAPVLPVLLPEDVGVDATTDQGGNAGAVVNESVIVADLA